MPLLIRNEKGDYNLKNFIFIYFVFLFFSETVLASTKILDFNWGDRKGVEKLLQKASEDHLESSNGFEIGPIFWKSLFDSQSFADHNAGDGLYFSTEPLDSARFGPSLLIVEIQISDPQDKDLLKVMAGEEAQVHPDRLPTIVSYRGSWHVLKSLPKDQRVRVWIRKPRSSDIERIFENYDLDSNKVKVLDLITQVAHRYAYHFRRFEKEARIPKEKDENRSTQNLYPN